eukprot:6189647-Pleurochrysis_carterae.AAC.3
MGTIERQIIACVCVTSTRSDGSAAMHECRLFRSNQVFFLDACRLVCVAVCCHGFNLTFTYCACLTLRRFQTCNRSLSTIVAFVRAGPNGQVLSNDWKKQVFLLSDRTVEFHSQFGKHHATRIPHFGRALAYHPETCELLLAGAERIAHARDPRRVLNTESQSRQERDGATGGQIMDPAQHANKSWRLWGSLLVLFTSRFDSRGGPVVRLCSLHSIPRSLDWIRGPPSPPCGEV